MRTIELTCKKCNGTMEVNEDEGKIVCPFCGTTNWIVESDEIRRDKAQYKFMQENEKAHADSAYKRDVAFYRHQKFKYVYITLAIAAAIALIIVISNNASKYAREHAHLAPPASASKLIGKQYSEVEKMFADAGFVNIKTEAIADLQNAFLYDAKGDVGKVTAVTIGGKKDFAVNEGFIFLHTDTFDKNDQVRITYRTLAKPTRTPEEIEADESMNADWTEEPTFLSAHETGKDQFTIIWEGKAPVYIVKVDGTDKATVADNKATFKLDNGTHNLQIIPVNRESGRDDIEGITGPISIRTSYNFNLDKYHMKKDHLVAGQFSEEKEINYTAEKIYDASPDGLTSFLDLHGAIHLRFIDHFKSDRYIVSYRTGSDEYSVAFSRDDQESAKWISTTADLIEIVLDPDFLQSKRDPIIQPDKDYTFSVQLQKKPIDYMSNEKAEKTLLSSQRANTSLKTTPVWKTAPVITFAEQTADGEVTIRWTHPGAELGYQYSVSLRSKAVFITTGESELIKVNGTEAVLKGLQNGNYTLVVTPEVDGQKGTSSAEFTVVVNNNWSQAPEVVLSQIDSRTAKAEITHIFGIEEYHIKILCGDSGNLLKYVDLDYSVYGEYTVDAVSPVTEYTFVYEKEAKPTDEIKVKFEIYGIHHDEDGKTYHSATRTAQITLKPEKAE